MIQLRPDSPVTVFDALAATADTKSESYMMPPNHNGMVSWQLSYAVAPTAVSVELQGSLVDTDALYSALDTSTNVNGELRTISNVNVKFLRVRQASRTGGTAHLTTRLQVN